MLNRAVDECLARIRACDHEVRAWVEVSPLPALADGPLRGIPFGVKDIFETKGMATEYGSPLYAHRKGSSDAAIVTDLRMLGAVLLGKTQTTAFASFDPAPTRNPRDLSRTPGGSSSGSAAAVAAGMASFALGTQTQGSILRPASFCGVAGFKPTFGTLPRQGVLPFAPSLDTVGLFTETAADMRQLWTALAVGRSQAPASRMAAFFLPCDPEMRSAFRQTIARLRAAGFRIVKREPPADLGKLQRASRTINDYEGARTHEQRWREHRNRIGNKLAAIVVRGLAMPASRYHKAQNTVAAIEAIMDDFFAAYPVLLTPAALGAAPVGLKSTGDPCMNAPWTALHVPAISIPMPVAGPPLGLQMIAARGQDDMLLETAAQVESFLC